MSGDRLLLCRRMNRYFLSIRAFSLVCSLLLALIASALLVAGCGGSSQGSSGDVAPSEITVETGTLSKAQFIQRADAICEDNRNQFTRTFNAYIKNHKLGGSPVTELAFIGGVVRNVLMPIYGDQVEEIGSLGAPASDKAKVTAFLKALQNRLYAIRGNPTLFARTITPFKAAEDLANSYGLTGCAESLS